MATNIASLLAIILEREPTKTELERLRKLAYAMHLAENDEFFVLLGTLEGYRNHFDDIPGMVTRQVKKAAEIAETQAITKINQMLARQENTLDCVMDRAGEISDSIKKASEYAEKQAKAKINQLAAEQQNALAHAVEKTAEKVAATASTKIRAAWIGGVALVCLLALLGSGFGGFKIGEKSGFAEARNEELVLKKRDAWSQTSSYKLALAYSEAGLLDKILDCRWRGWYIKDGTCYPAGAIEENKRQVYGWNMPAKPQTKLTGD